jgi:methoxymalonate biosynthesis acyl carrier protein
VGIETATVADAVRGWLRERIGGNLDVADDYDLIGNGVLTSLQTVELVMFLDEHFGIEITDVEFVEDNFRSIAAISRLVSSKQA